jgi:hypothetical protein
MFVTAVSPWCRLSAECQGIDVTPLGHLTFSKIMQATVHVIVMLEVEASEDTQCTRVV